jgi:hypothetical protein
MRITADPARYAVVRLLPAGTGLLPRFAIDLLKHCQETDIWNRNRAGQSPITTLRQYAIQYRSLESS